MIKRVVLGEELVITTKNKVGLLASVSMIVASSGINIEAACGYENTDNAVLLLITNANILILDELKKQGYSNVKEEEVVIVEISNAPGSMKVVATELGNKGIDIRHLYITSPLGSDFSRLILSTSDNEQAMSLLSRYVSA